MNAMEALFQPVPFGETRQSVLEKISTPENAPIWDMFRSIDPDKQHKVLLVSLYGLELLYLMSFAVHLGVNELEPSGKIVSWHGLPAEMGGAHTGGKG